MVTEVSYIDISCFTPELYERILSFLPAERKRKAEGYSFVNGKYLSAAAGYLVMLAVERRGFDADCAEICVENGGKPYIRGNPFYFSLSHSGNIALCAVSDGNVGADTERVTAIRESVIKGAYSPEEKRLIKKLCGEEKEKAFFRIWTAKESVIKYMGAGLSYPLKNIGVSLDGGVSAEINGANSGLFFKEYFIEGYKTTVCSPSDSFSENIEKIEFRL